MRIASRVCGAVGATIALFGTLLPWYSFGVVAPAGRFVQVFAVTTTLWGFTTLAPTLIVAGAVFALVLLIATDGRLAGALIGLVGLGILAYGVVRCFDLPHLGVTAVSAGGAIALRTITQLEGGPFVELAGGLMLVAGALGHMWPVPAELEAPELEAREAAARSGWTHDSGAAHPAR